jgi:hypothetical protein
LFFRLFPSILLNRPFDDAESFIWFYWTISLILLNYRALNEIIASPRYRNAERSPFR